MQGHMAYAAPELGGNLETRAIQLMTGDSGVKRMLAGLICYA